MSDTNILISYRVGEKNRAVLKEQLGIGARIMYLSDLPPGLRQQALVEATVMLSWNPPRELGPSEFGLLQNLRLLQLLSAGADHLPFDRLRKDIVIASNIGAYAEPMAEHVLAMTLALAKNLMLHHHELSQGKFANAPQSKFLKGGICGIIGFGGIGRAVAHRMQGMGMRIYAVNTSGWTDQSIEFTGTLKDLQLVLASSDVVVIAIPLTRETRNLIGKRELGWMKPDAILINAARAAIIGEEALYHRLKTHPTFQAGTDVWWVEPFNAGEFRMNYPFFTLPNFIGSPHNSAIVPGINESSTKLAVENIKRFLRGERIVGEVRREEYLSSAAP
jgi:phosphoglycerate dehydrogenase-like enzyme